MTNREAFDLLSGEGLAYVMLNCVEIFGLSAYTNSFEALAGLMDADVDISLVVTIHNYGKNDKIQGWAKDVMARENQLFKDFQKADGSILFHSWKTDWEYAHPMPQLEDYLK